MYFVQGGIYIGFEPFVPPFPLDKSDNNNNNNKMKCEVIPIVVGGLGCVTARLEMYYRNLLLISFVLWNYYNEQQF